MSEVKVCKFQELGEGKCKAVQIGERLIAIARVDGEIFAMDDTCPHRGGPLSEGDIEDGHLHCPLHGWAFDLRTGEMQGSPMVSVRTHAARVEGDDVLVSLSLDAPKERG